jgi:general secretion pathway protein D
MGMPAHKIRTGFLLIITGAVLSACAGAVEKTMLPSAGELAHSALPSVSMAEAKPPAPPALNLPRPDTRPLLQEINHSGSLPAVRSVAPEIIAPLPQNFSSGQPVHLDYEQVELRKVLEELADVMGLSVVVDASIADLITVRTSADKPLNAEDLWPLFQLLMVDNNITLERKGAIHHLKRAQDALPAVIGGPHAGLEHSSAPEVMQITPLRFITVDAALAALRPIVEPQGRIVSLPNLNVLGVISSPARLGRVNSLVNLLDSDPFVHRGMRLFRLNNTKATDIQVELDKIFKAVEGSAPTYQLIALERINAILAVAPPRRGFTEVERWIQILDEANEESGEQVFIYRVRNMEAGKLAATLSEVFKEDEKDKKDIPQRQIPLDPQTLADNPDALQQLLNAPTTRRSEGALQVSAALKVNIVASEDSNSLIIRARPRDYRQLLETISILDQVPKEVMINMVVAEVSLTESTRFGINWQALLGKNLGERYRTIATNSFSGIAANATGLVIDYAGNTISALLNLIATDNDVQVLSRPSILVRNNQQASMNVGSDEPTITRMNTTAQATTTNYLTTSNEVQYRNTGIILQVTPHINEDGIINIEVAQEVSSLGPVRTDQQLPSFTTRKFETSLLVRDGNAIILGGLIETRSNNDLSGLPGLMEIPVVGKAFSSESRNVSRTELVVIIIPEIIDPEADNRAYMEAFTRRMKAVENVLNEQPIALIDFIAPPMITQESQ